MAMAKKSKSAIAADNFNAIIGVCYSVVNGVCEPSKADYRLSPSDIKCGRKNNPIRHLYTEYNGMWAGVAALLDKLTTDGYAPTAFCGLDYKRSLLKWLEERKAPVMLSVKDDHEYVFVADKKSLTEALGCK